MDRTLPFAQTTRELELVSSEDEAYQVSQQPPPIFLRGVDGLVPLFVSDEERVILQELFTALQGECRIRLQPLYFHKITLHAGLNDSFVPDLLLK